MSDDKKIAGFNGDDNLGGDFLHALSTHFFEAGKKGVKPENHAGEYSTFLRVRELACRAAELAGRMGLQASYRIPQIDPFECTFSDVIARAHPGLFGKELGIVLLGRTSMSRQGIGRTTMQGDASR